MCEVDESRFINQQEMEQLNKGKKQKTMTCCLMNSVIFLTPSHYIVLISLVDFYDDLRPDDIRTKNEAEFRGYHIIAHFSDQDVVRQTMTSPLELFKHPQIQLTLKFHSLAQRNK
jgi:hypothetical protein